MRSVITTLSLRDGEKSRNLAYSTPDVAPMQRLKSIRLEPEQLNKDQRGNG